jgi:hypothetical protein
MAIGAALLKLLGKKYEPSGVIDKVFGKYDLTFITDENGDPVQLFIGKRKENGHIKGDRYTRVLKKDAQGNRIKDHWDLKGKTN